MTLKDKITSVVTGDAYDKPAKTADGAMTTQDSADAHTLKGTSADPNPPPTGPSKIETYGDKAKELGDQAEAKVKDAAGTAQDKADNTEAGQKAQEAAKKA